jgi:hypothetical protein
MLRFHIVRARTVALLAFGLIFAAIGYAAASANTVATSKAGDGGGAVTSYVLDPTSIQVTLDTDNDPAVILKVRFTIASSGGVPAPQTVKAGFLSSGGALLGNWYGTCTIISGTTWECLPGGANARAENGIRLRVIAVR